MNDEKPRSTVMPRRLLSGCLSSAAVLRQVDSARTRLVLPASTWPNTPTFTLATRPVLAMVLQCGAMQPEGCCGCYTVLSLGAIEFVVMPQVNLAVTEYVERHFPV